MLLGRLGASYRTDDPARSLDYYRRASEIQPDAAEYAIGYAAALVQARRFADAARILQQVVRLDPRKLRGASEPRDGVVTVEAL